jgi:hypothetical protein
MTANELIGKITDRIEYLGNLSMDSLRKTHPDVCVTGSTYEANLVTQGMTRGQIMAYIILDEFSLEFDAEIES